MFKTDTFEYKQFIDYFKNYIIESWSKGGKGLTRSGKNASSHPMSGAFIDSLEVVERSESNKIIVDIIGNEYGVYLNYGVSASKVPYSPGKGNGGKSKYITGIHEWVKRKLGKQDPEALGITFAIARSHSEHGFPERNGNPPGSKWLDPDEIDSPQLDMMTDMFVEYIEKEMFKGWE